MTSQISFTLATSGQPQLIPNEIQNGTSLTVSYVPSISGQSFTVTCEAILDGEATAIDSVTATGNVTSRSISLNFTPDAFRFTATWANAAQQFSVAASVSSKGNGPAYSAAQNLTNVHTAS